MCQVDPDMEHLYMPSQWVKRISGDESLKEYAEWTKRESDKARSHYTARLDIISGDGKIDLFNESAKSDKLVVFIAGGYWVFGCGEESAWTVLPLVQEGHTVAVIHYDRAPTSNMTRIVTQVEHAMDWIIKYAMNNKKKVWLSGHSAGSQLCAMFLSSAWYQGLTLKAKESVEGVIHLSGVFNLEPILKTSVNLDLKLSPVEVRKFSPLSPENVIRLCEHKHLKHYQIIGEFDSPAFHQQAQQYRDALASRGVDASLTVLPDCDHFNLALDLSYYGTPSTNKFLQLMKSWFKFNKYI